MMHCKGWYFMLFALMLMLPVCVVIVFDKEASSRVTINLRIFKNEQSAREATT